MSMIDLQTGTRVFEVLAYLCHSPLEALKQFVENGSDAIGQAGRSDGQIRIRLDHSPSRQSSPMIVVEDNGIGMDSAKMSRILQRIGDSEKLEHVLRGEKGIGLLAFALIADELHLSSANGGGTPSCLVLRRAWLREGKAQLIRHCPQHHRAKEGTRVHLLRILPEIASQLTKARLKQYLSREFATDLRRNLYTIHIGDGHGYEAVEPRLFSGIPAVVTNLALGPRGHASIQLYTLPFEAEGATIDLYGRGGIRICALTDLEEFNREPWLGQRLEGSVRCDRLRGTADKAAVVQDEVYKALVEVLHSLEPQIMEKIGQVTQDYRENRLAEIMRRVDRFIGYFLHYKETGGMPRMATVAEGETAPSSTRKAGLSAKPSTGGSSANHSPRNHISFLQADLCLPPEGRAQLRAWSDNGGTVKINMLHTDFLAAEKDDKRCAWYLFSVWAKQFLLAEYGVNPEVLADEMVGLFSQAGPLLNQITIRPHSRTRGGKSL